MSIDAHGRPGDPCACVVEVCVADVAHQFGEVDCVFAPDERHVVVPVPARPWVPMVGATERLDFIVSHNVVSIHRDAPVSEDVG